MCRPRLPATQKYDGLGHLKSAISNSVSSFVGRAISPSVILGRDGRVDAPTYISSV